ncbi:Tripartite tricarboxylate transporter TctB family protein [Aidingimonas halophila]|uniref:Tripartite tricarboxylate transporter TctB family protein n=2 Tax=Aidingimonas halophila TaxID=574349 RepID=A0A1H3F6N7_9GAMM|nr:Tripartite tricarboxylate transporter TctB family protein [Aidingimonas halophila]
MSMFEITIPFDQSHLFFPRIITWLLGGLFVLVLMKYARPIMSKYRSGGMTELLDLEEFHKFKFFGTIVLVALYFIMMDVVGSWFPNMGFGFLFVSMPFIFLMGMMYVHEITKATVTKIVIVSLVSPLLAWFVLARLFDITLP